MKKSPTAAQAKHGASREPELSLERSRPWFGGALREQLAILLFFVAATLVLAWPIPFTLGEASGARGDYFNNLWNAWWLRESLAEGRSPYWTDFLYYPDGISLRRHTLSPTNAVPAAILARFVDADAAFNLLLLAHFALAGWALALLAREVTGSRAGALLGGLVFTFSPFHVFYLCQINVFALGFVPLALFFLLRVYRAGGRVNTALFVASLALLTGSHEYYVVYVYLLIGLLLLVGKPWMPEVPFREAAKRTLVAALLGAVAAALVDLPLLVATLGAESGAEAETAAFLAEKRRFNDLLGFRWIGGPEEAIVGWPTMLGYSTLFVCVLGFRGLRRQAFWLLAGALFLVLSFGAELEVAGSPTGITLPFGWLESLPLFSLLRKADRGFVMVELAVALCFAAAWPAIGELWRRRRARAFAWAACALVPLLELFPAPFLRFEHEPPAWMQTLAADASVTAVLDLPTTLQPQQNARYLLDQTVHGKKIALGYTTAFAATPEHEERTRFLAGLYADFVRQQTRSLVRFAEKQGFDLVVHRKSEVVSRPPDETVDGRILWKPFVFLRRGLVGVRQRGPDVERPYTPDEIDALRALFTQAFGEPLHEDAEILVYRVPEAD